MNEVSAEQFEELLAAYALNALEPDERAYVAAQVAAHPQYAAMLAEYDDALTGLAMLAPSVEPPVGHFERMVARLNEASAPPAPAPPARTIAPAAGWWQRISDWFAAPARLSGSLAALSLLLVVGMLIWNFSLQSSINSYQTERDGLRGQISSLQQQATNLQTQMTQATADREKLQKQLGDVQGELATMNAMADLMGKPGTMIRQIPGNYKPDANSQLIANPNTHQAYLLAYNLTPAPANMTYEFWLVAKDGKHMPAGTFRVDESGKGMLTVVMPDVPMSDIAGAGVSMEPGNGGPTPSGEMVIEGKL